MLNGTTRSSNTSIDMMIALVVKHRHVLVVDNLTKWLPCGKFQCAIVLYSIVPATVVLENVMLLPELGFHVGETKQNRS